MKNNKLHELETIRQSGEGYMVEFKRNVEDDGNIVGSSINNETNARVQMMARDCDPAISIELEFFNDVLIVHVPEGKDKPYRCTNV